MRKTVNGVSYAYYESVYNCGSCVLWIVFIGNRAEMCEWIIPGTIEGVCNG